MTADRTSLGRGDQEVKANKEQSRSEIATAEETRVPTAVARFRGHGERPAPAIANDELND